MYNFNSTKRKRWIAVIGIILAAALLITTVISGFFL
jgi:uncharacterized SAM-binding protein YcdF (DUF218 family)